MGYENERWGEALRIFRDDTAHSIISSACNRFSERNNSGIRISDGVGVLENSQTLCSFVPCELRLLWNHNERQFISNTHFSFSQTITLTVNASVSGSTLHSIFVIVVVLPLLHNRVVRLVHRLHKLADHLPRHEALAHCYCLRRQTMEKPKISSWRTPMLLLTQNFADRSQLTLQFSLVTHVSSHAVQNDNQKENEQQETHGTGEEHYRRCLQIRILFHLREEIVRRVLVPMAMHVCICNERNTKYVFSPRLICSRQISFSPVSGKQLELSSLPSPQWSNPSHCK